MMSSVRVTRGPMSLAKETRLRWIGVPGSMTVWLICCGMT